MIAAARLHLSAMSGEVTQPVEGEGYAVGSIDGIGEGREESALANAIIVLRHGKVVEQGPARTVFAKPKTDYTKALLAAAFELEATRGGVVAT